MKNWIKWNSIKNRLFLTVSISSATIIITLVLLNSIVLRSFYLYAKTQEIRDCYEQIHQIDSTTPDEIEEELIKIAQKNNFEIMIENRENMTIFSSSNRFTEAIYKNRYYIYSLKNMKLIFHNDKISISRIKFNGMNCILLFGQLNDIERIYIQAPIADLEKSVSISNHLLLIMGMIIILIAALVASVISKIFTKPIVQLKKITNQMAKLDFSEKYILTDSDDEINELGNNINIMSDKLEKTIKQLRSNNNQLEKDIEEKSKIDEMRKQFISDVSHELKTPIALIQGYAEGLLENVTSDEEAKQHYAEVILDESNRMDKLVKQLLQLMKLEYGKMKFKEESFDICELIEEVIRRCQMMSDEKKVTVSFRKKDAFIVKADAYYIEQVFTNYLTNAIKHVKEINGEKLIKITIKMNKETQKVRVSVFNTGEQIAEENLEKIWGRFYKIDESRNREDGGTGIGLALVKAIMTNYQEKYGVKNKENGVEFYFECQQAE